MKYKAAIFDMDGTVLDTLGDLTDSTNAVLREYGYPVRTEDEVRSFVGNGALRLLQLAVPAGTPESVIQEMLVRYKEWYNSHSKIRTTPYSGITDLLNKLRTAGMLTAIVSNKPDMTVRELDSCFFPGCTDFRLGESPAMKRKPAPDMVLECARVLGCGVTDCVYIGDSEVDILTARNAGMDCISVSWGFRTKEQLIASGAKMITDTVDELQQLLLCGTAL